MRRDQASESFPIRTECRMPYGPHHFMVVNRLTVRQTCATVSDMAADELVSASQTHLDDFLEFG